MDSVRRSDHGAAGPLALLRPDILALAPYIPIEPVEILAARYNVAPERIAKLDANENLYGPSPRALAALAELRDYHIYPDPDLRLLRAALAEHTGAPVESIVCGAGSDELIQLLAALFLTPGDAVIDLPPTFGMYPFETGIAGGRTVSVPRRADFSIDLAGIRAAIAAHGLRTKLIFVTHPNNPSGNLASAEELEALLAFGVPVVVDEAYIEFAGLEYSVLPLLKSHSNLIVLRTFSKWAGLAGLRIGYGVMAPALAEVVLRVRQPYGVNVAAEVAATASLADAPELMARVRLIVAERERLVTLLAPISFLRPEPSTTNFVLCSVLRGEARQIRDSLQLHGVFVRYFDRAELRNALRVSVGLPHHTEQLIAALAAVGRELQLI